MGTILVPTDDSEHVGKAVALAADIAARYGARLVLLHVVAPGPWPEGVRRLAQSEHLVGAKATSRGLSDLRGLVPGSVSHKVNALAGCTCITVR